jgi:Right handed beta helix region
VVFTFMSPAMMPALAVAETPVTAAGNRNAASVPKPRVIQVGRDHAIRRIADAARRARSGDVIEVEAGEYAGDVASWRQNNLTIRAVGGRARLISKGVSAEGKAIWVIKGDNVLVENFEFAGARAPGRNGAGIRHEGGKLTVRNCLFEGNEMGLLTWNDERASLIVEKSEFRDNAVASDYHRGDPIGHQIYVGTIGMFMLTDSYVHHGAFGHLVKSRARESRILNNRITDENAGRASYELEFPNGGIAYIVGNIIQQSPRTENATIVSFGAEGYRWQRNEIYVVNDTLVDDLPHGGKFFSITPGADKVEILNNLLVGRGGFDPDPSWNVVGNARAAPDDIPLAGVGDYRLDSTSRLVGTAVDPGAADGVSLRLEREYVHPHDSHTLHRAASNPGALQTLLQ